MQDPFLNPTCPIIVPDLGSEPSTPILLVNWLVSPGDSLIAGERVAELLIDSCLFHLESEHCGQLAEVFVPRGAKVRVGESIAAVRTEVPGD